MATKSKRPSNSDAVLTDPYDLADRSFGGNRRHKTRWVAAIAAIVLLALFAITGSTAYAGYSLYQSYQTVQTEVGPLRTNIDTLVDAVKTGDVEAIQSSSDSIAASVDVLKKATEGTVWDLAEMIPVYGADVKASRELVSVADELAHEVLEPMTPVLVEYPRQSITSDGQLNTDAIIAYCQAISTVSPHVQSVSSRLDAIDAPHISQVNDTVEKLSKQMSHVSYILKTYDPVLQVLPYVLGCYSPRHYLVVALNNDELTSVGGFAGAMIPVTVTNGSIEIGDVYSRDDFVEDGSIPVDLAEEEGDLFAFVGYSIGNIGMIPDFSRAASAWNKFWIADYGMSFDGVISIDPVMLQRIVGLIGDITMPDGNVLTGSTTARILLHDVYRYFPNDNDMQDYYFALAADSITSKLIESGIGSIDISELLDTVKNGLADGRLHVWFANTAEQEVFESFGATGTLFDDPEEPTLGVYLNDNTWSKIDWWIDSETAVSDPVQNPDGTVTYWGLTTIRNDATWNEIWNSSHYEYGTNSEKHDTGDMITIVYLFAPVGGHFTDVSTSDDTAMTFTEFGGHEVIWAKFHTEPGEATTIAYNVTYPAAEKGLSIYVTPTAAEARLAS